MQAMTDIPFMNAYHRIFGGFDQMMAPYLMASSQSPMKLSRLRKLYAAVNPDIDFIPQILGKEAEGFIHLAGLLHELGYEEVNWNLGCPYIFVTKKQRGSGLLPYPDLIDALLEEIMAKVQIRVSVKIRLGLHSDKEIDRIIPVLNRYPLSEVIVHPRTAQQLYAGKADLGRFRDVFALLKTPVVYNGDLVSKEQVLNLDAEMPGIAGYMIGRGAFINPFITAQIKGLEWTEQEKRSKYKDLYMELFESYVQRTQNDEGLLHRMKELWQYFAQSFEGGDALFAKLRRIESRSAFEQEAGRIFEQELLLY